MENIKAGLEFAEQYNLNPTEIKVVLCIIDGNVTAQEIMKATGMSFTHAHKVLITLRHKEVITCKRKSKFLIYELIKNG